MTVNKHIEIVKRTGILTASVALALFMAMVWAANPPSSKWGKNNFSVADTTDPDSTGKDSIKPVKLRYDFEDRRGDRYTTGGSESPFYLKDPSNIQTSIEYDPINDRYYINETIGKEFYRNPNYLTFDEFVNNEFKRSTHDYWRQRAGEDNLLRKNVIPKMHVGGKVFRNIFGSDVVDIRPQGSAELIFAANISRNDNPALPEKQRRIGTFDFDEKVQMNVIANIGDKMKLSTNYNTEATFDFENKMKLEYTGYEDDIIKKIEAGNVALPLSGSLITGSQSLFGLKTQLQFGRLTVTSVLSQQKGKTSTVEVTGGAQTSNFSIQADQYEANKHYFVAQYFKDKYDDALAGLPVIASGINITRVEVWITNKNNAVDNTRNIVAFMDLGEGPTRRFNNTFVGNGTSILDNPSNESNDLYSKINTGAYNGIRDLNKVASVLGPLSAAPDLFIATQDYEKLENARKLSTTEYTFNTRLGFISLNQALNADEVLAVAYEYTLNGVNYKVGELTTDGISAPNALYVKLIKSSNLSVKLPLWDLMMKNIYTIGAYQVSNKDFRLDVMYADAATGTQINYIPAGDIKGIPLIKVLRLDNLNYNGDPQPDGMFDFMDGVTIQASNGRIIFPVREPFGNYLRSKFTDQTLANKYVFDALYDSTRSAAQQQPELNKFHLKGSYQSSSSSEISLNAINIPQGSVSVTAGGIRLVENQDYTVDYTLGRVKIINEGILNSGTPIKISLESNTLFSIQSKTFMGSRFDYMVNRDFNLGGTILYLKERPFTNKVNIGDEPIANTIWGVDGTYRTDSRFITRLIDRLPFLDTKEMSNVTVSAEFANLVPGHPRNIGKSGTSYIDDFEGSRTPIDIKSPGMWVLASTPQGQPSLFPEGGSSGLEYGFNRSRLAWYIIDPLFLRNNNITPDHIKNDVAQQSNHFVREILETELFPNKEAPNGQVPNLPVLNLAYYPFERGPYNYDTVGFNADGTLKSPEKRWGGIMRRIETNDFEAANIEFVEFWVMDPFVYDPTHSGGDLYFNIGNISEDILKDGRKSFENGLPPDGSYTNSDSTAWGKVPAIQAIVNVFDNNADNRKRQDVGYDGLMDSSEARHFGPVLAAVKTKYGASTAWGKLATDPSSDNYHYFRGSDFDNPPTSILDRYKYYNGVDGNSPTDELEDGKGKYTPAYTTIPDAEDLNRDNTLSEYESYYQYKITLRPDKMKVGENFITDIAYTYPALKDGTKPTVKWYQFKVPVQGPDRQTIGSIEDFKSIRFIRMFLKGWTEDVVLRMAKLDLVRGEWRKYNYSLLYPGEYLSNDKDTTNFDVSAVNLEENGSRSPIPYVLPPGIEQERAVQTTNLQRLNEQSLVLKVCDLADGDSRAAYKNTQFDVRQYKRIKMFVHAESSGANDALRKGELSVFVRLGTDFTGNYYEYEIPLTPTAWGTKDPSAIWPDANMLDIDLEKLQVVKQRRNNEMLINKNITLFTPYTGKDGERTITVVGTPNLSNIRTIMIGVRNPKRDPSMPGDDGLPKCGEVWVNELRLTDFDEKGGWAANARMTAKLADLGMLTVAGSKSTFGFGSLDKKVNERSKMDITQYDVSTNLELGKFLPEKTGIKVPAYLGYSEAISRPQYNPTDPDILMKTALAAVDDSKTRDSIKSITEDYTLRRSMNFTNVKKNKVNPAAKSHFYDVENIALTYAYTEMYRRNVTTQHSTTKTYKGAVSYNFNTTPKNIAPFSKSKTIGKYKYLRPVKDFNFYYMPSSVAFRTDVDRQFSETLLRNTTGSPEVTITPTFNKIFSMTRLYDLKYDLTRSLKLDFNAINNATIDEPEGRIDTDEKKDSVRKNFYDLGRTTRYHHTANLNYTVPINKFPITDWTSLTYRYGVDYDWNTASQAAIYLGNTIQNSSSHQYNGQFNMTTLYNKVGYFKKINQKKNAPKPAPKPAPKVPKDSTGKALPKPPSDSTKKKVNPLAPLFENGAKLLMSVKSLSFTYSETQGTMLPGYKRKTYLMGNEEYNGEFAPGPGFVFGQQRPVEDSQNIRYLAAQKGWLTNSPLLNTPYTQTNVRNFTARGNAEPIKGLRVDFNASRNYSRNHNEYFRFDSVTQDFRSFSPSQTGNFSISTITWKTAFKKDDKEIYTNEFFENFMNYRNEIAARRSKLNTNYTGGQDSTGFPDGYSRTSQEVLIPAFLAAYTGKSPTSVGLAYFMKIPKPNWRITYDGLSKLPFVQKYFNSITLGHAYRSTFNISSYITNLSYEELGGSPSARNTKGDYISKYEIAQVSMSEQFSPLFNIDATLKNNMTTRFEIKKDRTLSMNFSNTQLTEVRGSELVIGIGYRLKPTGTPIKIGGKKIKLTNDLNLKTDFSIRNNYTVIRRMDVGGSNKSLNQPSAGMKIFKINVSADYIVNERFNLRLFYDKIINKPVVSSTFPTANTNAGVSLRFTLSQ